MMIPRLTGLCFPGKSKWILQLPFLDQSVPQLFCHWPHAAEEFSRCILPHSSYRCWIYIPRYPEKSSAGAFVNEDTGKWGHSLHLPIATWILTGKQDGSFVLWLHHSFLWAPAVSCVWVSQARTGWWFLTALLRLYVLSSFVNIE